MAAFLTAADEKMALARAAEPLIGGNAAADAESLNSLAPATARRCCRGTAVRRTIHWVLASLFVVSWCVLAFGVTSMAAGSRFHQKPCHDGSATNAAIVHPEIVHPDGHRSHQHSHEAAIAAAAEAAVAANTVPVGPAAGPLSPVVVDADNNGEAPAPASASSFARLLEAVSPEALHDLLHAYLPDTYKHGVYPSEKSALAALHRANAPLATSIVQLARRDTNATVSAATSSVAPTSSQPAAASSSPVTVVSPTPTSATPTSSGPAATTNPTTAESTKAAATTATPTAKDTATTAPAATTKAAGTTPAGTTPSGRKVTSTYTSTINGTPTVVTATSIVGVAATGSDSTQTGTATVAASGTLQTGAAAPGSVGSMRMVGVAGLLAGAALLV